MAIYQVPEYLEVVAYENRLRRAARGELTLRFGAGSLRGRTYQPLGVSGLWALVGTVASLGAPLLFVIREGMREGELHGGFADGKFCLFTVAKGSVKVFTRTEKDFAESQLVVLEDRSHGFVHWIPNRAMMTFEDFVEVGNALLLGTNRYAEATVLQADENWKTGFYYANPEDGKARPRANAQDGPSVVTIQLPE